MPTWGEILNEFQRGKSNPRILDNIRNKYIKELYDLTKRDVIIYAAKWTTGDIPPNFISIIDDDIVGFMEAMSGLKGNSLDLIIHTGGGSAEATEAIVSYLRLKYPNDIRIIVPQAAMSAGTMLACASDNIVMAKHSSLGPIDPQFILQTSVGIQVFPAHAILEQFELAQEECSNDPKKLNSWLPMLSQYGPALLVRCKNQIEYSTRLVRDWLKVYMFKEQLDSNLPESISQNLCDHKTYKTHSKHINIVEAKSINLKITELELNQDLQEKVLSAFHATIISFNYSGCVKVIANHNGNAFIKTLNPQVRIPAKPPKSSI